MLEVLNMLLNFYLWIDFLQNYFIILLNGYGQFNE